MHIVGKELAQAQAFMLKHSTALSRWIAIAEAATWNNLEDVKQSWSVDYLPVKKYCFDIGGNNFRLICQIIFLAQSVQILEVMTHADTTRGGDVVNQS
jgi:mRNA-degrading endonuclease HigB of HigAB toxin-antitoxin module